jgi:hypothetical protein
LTATSHGFVYGFEAVRIIGSIVSVIAKIVLDKCRCDHAIISLLCANRVYGLKFLVRLDINPFTRANFFCEFFHENQICCSDITIKSLRIHNPLESGLPRRYSLNSSTRHFTSTVPLFIKS